MSFWDDISTSLGFEHPNIPAGAIGTSLNTSNLNPDEQNQQAYLTQLMQQGRSGNPAAMRQLQQGYQQANQSAMALGQSTAANQGQNAMSARRGIENAQAANQQTAYNQGQALQAQGQMQAQGLAGGVASGLASNQLNQAMAQQQAQGQVNALNQQAAQKGGFDLGNTIGKVGQGLASVVPFLSSGGEVPDDGFSPQHVEYQTDKNPEGYDPQPDDESKKGSPGLGGIVRDAGNAVGGLLDDVGKTAQSALDALSSGGEVDGRAKTPGDSPSNDTVLALLSPGEIVVPRSHASDPDMAAEFARAVAAKHGPSAPKLHFDDGGGVSYTGSNLFSAGNQQAPGSMDLNASSYDQTRSAQLGLQGMLQQRAAGGGPSMVAPEMQQAQNSNMGKALLAQSRGAGTNAIGAGSAGAQQIAGLGGQMRLGEIGSAQGALANAQQGMTSNDLAVAKANQQAELQQQALNMGIAQGNATNVGNFISGIGQGLTGAGSQMQGAPQQPYAQGVVDDAFNAPTSGQVGDFGGGGNDSGDGGGIAASSGGMVPGETESDDERAKAFMRAIQRHTRRKAA